MKDLSPTTSDDEQPKAVTTNPIMKAFNAVLRFFGFSKAYNFILYTITIGALTGFVLARFQYLDINGTFFQESIPGEAFWYQAGFRRVGIIIHLVGILFSSVFVWIQFTPIIRYKALWLHRINGYFVTFLLLLSTAGALMITDRSIGGIPAFRVWTGILATVSIFAIFNAWINIKRLQIDQHRAWMIRTWAWTANVVTLRLLLLASQHVVRTYGIEMYTPIRCEEIFFMYSNNAGLPDAQNPTPLLYPACGPDASSNHLELAISSIGTGPENIAAEARPLFLMAAWMAIVIHIMLTELYLWLTPAESFRLRVLSRQRQIEKGYITEDSTKSAGLLTSINIGDAPRWWSKPVEEHP